MFPHGLSEKYLNTYRVSWFRTLSADQFLISIIYVTTLTLSLSAENVQCDRCKKYFHMSCVQPPLQAKPSRGYGWTCAPCSRKHEEEVDSHDVRYPTQQLHAGQMRHQQGDGDDPARIGRKPSVRRISQSSISICGHSDTLGKYTFIF